MKTSKGVILIMPRKSDAWSTAEALWITVAGWAVASRRAFGNCWIVTSDKIAQPEEVVRYPDRPTRHAAKGRASLVPMFLRIIAADIRLFIQRRNWNILAQQPWSGHNIQFVWEQHDLFPGPGARLARRLKIPLIMFVHGPVVWESRKWGVKRGLWGRWLERFVESRSLRRADVVACVSPQVAEKVASMGVAASRICVSPMAADPELFVRQARLFQQTGAKQQSEVTIGWIGSFRSFHGLDHLVDAFRLVHMKFPQVRLVLVGDGKEKADTEALVKKFGLTQNVTFTGRKSFTEIPSCICEFDICVVSTRAASDFHYSPLKLREYLVAGRAVVAPDAGEIPKKFTDGEHLLLYKTGNVESLASRLNVLVNDEQMRRRIADSGKKYALEHCTWDAELRRVLPMLSMATR